MMRLVDSCPEEDYTRIVVPRVESGVGFYSTEILNRGMSISISINAENLEFEEDVFENVTEVHGLEVTVDEGESLDDWYPRVFDSGSTDLSSQAKVARENNKLTRVLNSLPEKHGVLVIRERNESGLVLLAVSAGVALGRVQGKPARELIDFVAELAEKSIALEVTIGHEIAEHHTNYGDEPGTTRQLEGRLHIPPPSRLIKWCRSDDGTRAQMNLSKPAFEISPIRDSKRFQENIDAVLGGLRRWSGVAQVEPEPLTTGKYAGDTRLNYFINGLQVGRTHPQFRKQEPNIFDYVERGGRKIPARTSFDYGEASMMPDLGLRFEAVVDLDEL
jgi:hypothetical protein